MSKLLLKKVKAVRANNNSLWMRLIGLGLECDEIKASFQKITKQIVKNDLKIQKLMKRVTG